MESATSGHGYALAARLLIRSLDRVALATRMAAEDRPYASLAAYATDVDGAPLLLLSQLSEHTRNIGADARLSMLFDGTAGFANPQEGPRATILGRIEQATDADRERIRRRYFARHPGAAMYAGFADFAFYRIEAERIHWVGGFGRAAWVDRPMTVDAATAAKFVAAEPDLLERLARKADRIAAARLKRRSRGWTITAVDPDGCVLVHGKRAVRLAFDASLADPSDVEDALAGRRQRGGSG